MERGWGEAKNYKKMKKHILSIALLAATLSQAQVIISNQASPTPTNSSVLLEFGNNENKGIILPSVSEVTNPVAGTFAVNTTAKAVQYYDGTAWVNLTYPDVLVENSFINDGTADAGEGVVIGAASSTKPGVLVLESTTQAMVLPHVADPHLNVLSPVAGTMVYDTTSDALAVYDGVEWSYWAAELDASGILPPNITLLQNRRHWIASVYDTDYLPYTPPAGAANINVVNADGTPDAVTVDVQGSITETGITVRIPIASVTGSGNILAWTSTFVVPAMYAEDGQSRTLELSWAAQSYTSTSTYITATIKSLGGTFLAKKLDINAGIGNDYLGLLLGAFQYPYNNAGAITGYEVRDIPGIPDRMFGLSDASSLVRHNFLYLPIEAEDGRVWLNNNLGANYTNINHSSFNITQQATSTTDANAYGSLYQWGRFSDGHEFRTSTTTATRSTTDTPGHSNFITHSNSPFDWRNPQNNNLWQGESGANNPCPHGFRLPTITEISAMASAEGITNFSTLASSTLKIAGSGGGFRERSGTLFTNAFYLWSSTTDASSTSARAMFVNTTGAYPENGGLRVMGGTVRCIQD